jgi:hypothetical protein
MSSTQFLFDEPIIIEEAYETEPGYTPPRRIYLGLRYRFILRDQIGTPIDIYVDRKDQIWTFIEGFGSLLQKGQIVRFECDMLGIHGWIHGEQPINRDTNGNRIMLTHGDAVFDDFIAALDISPSVRDELRAWKEFTAHNPDWYLRKMKERAKHHA